MTLEDGCVGSELDEVARKWQDKSFRRCSECYNSVTCEEYRTKWSETFHQNGFDNMIFNMKKMQLKLAETCEDYYK